MNRHYLHIIFVIVNTTFAQTAINKEESITIGGIKQYISIKGKDNSKPILLYLHGGPGGSVMHYANKFTSKLQEHFIVVQWDQRETGRTVSLNVSPIPLTLKLFQQDTHDLIDSLLNRYHQTKLYLVGHSWGTVLGFHMAEVYPELLHAYVAISPMINQLESEKIILSKMKVKAKQSDNQIEIKELEQIKIPFEKWEHLYYHRKWLFDFHGQTVKKFTKSYAQTWASTWLTVWNEASKINLMEKLKEVKCPVYFFIGRRDYQTNGIITETYYTYLRAPRKQLFWFENSGHGVPTSEPALMQSIIIDQILKETLPKPIQK